MKASTAALSIAHLISAGTKLGILILLMQAGGLTAAGEYSLALAVVTPVFILFGLSLRQIYVTHRQNTFYSHFLTLRALYGIFGVLIVCVIALLLFRSMLPLFAAMSLYRYVELLVDIRIAHFQRKGQIFLMALSTAGFSIITATVLAIAFVLTDNLSIGVLTACVAGGAVFAVLTWTGPRPEKASRWFPRKSLFIEVSRGGAMLSVSSFAVSMGTNIPVLLLSAFHSPAAVGIYSAIFNLTAISNILFSSVSQAELRGFVELAQKAHFRRFLRRGRSLSWVLLVPAFVGTILLYFVGTDVFSFVFGEDFSSYRAALMVMGATICITPFGFMLDVQLTALQRFSVQSALSLITLGLTMVLGLLLIPDMSILGCTLIVFAIMLVRNTAKHFLLRSAVHRTT